MTSRTRRPALPPPGVARERLVLAALTLAALALTYPALLRPLMPDEAGFLLVAQHWDPSGEGLYGDLWVDRPPLLIATYAGASALLGDYGVRVLSAVLTVVSVLAAHRSGTLLGGPRSGRWAAAAVVVLTGWPSLAVWAGKSESLGVPFVLLACWLVLESLHRRGPAALLLALGAGTASAVAVGMKQNLLGGVIFIAVLLLAHLVRGSLPRGEVVARIAVSALGALLPIAVVLAWGQTHDIGPGVFWDSLYGFRAEALGTLTAADSVAASRRALRLLGLLVGTGIALQLAWLLVQALPLLRRAPEATLAVTGLAAFDLLGVVLGGSYWPAYLQVLVPGVALAVALTTTLPGRRTLVPRAVTLASVLAMLVASFLHGAPRGESTSDTYIQVGRSIGEVAHADDSIIALYGSPQVLWASGLRPAYRHLWSLPTRTLDPDLEQMHALLASPQAPTWVVLLGPVGTWGLDADGAVRDVLTRRYTEVGRVCGVRVGLLRTQERPPLPPVDCAAAVPRLTP